jgi:hypothetical protein
MAGATCARRPFGKLLGTSAIVQNKEGATQRTWHFTSEVEERHIWRRTIFCIFEGKEERSIPHALNLRISFNFSQGKETRLMEDMTARRSHAR